MAKQEAFEEKMRLKNQFRALDEDEVDFLDSVLESTRAQEEAVRKDTADQLEIFRKQREEAEKVLLGPTSSEIPPTEEEEWSIPARKRRRDKGKDLLVPGKKWKASAGEGGGIATVEPERKVSTSASVAAPGSKIVENAAKGRGITQKSHTPQQADTKDAAKTASGSLGLVSYGSDSDSD